MSDTLIGAAGVLVSLVFGWLEYKRGDSDIYKRAHDLLPAGEQWELNESLREAGDWDPYR